MRALRRRRGWRQSDLATQADCAQATISDAERGHLPSVPILRRILAALDAQLVTDVRWRAGELERLLDAAHAALGEVLTRLLVKAGWDVRVEVTYSEYGERGSIDLLAFLPSIGTLLVVELKTDITSVELTLRKVDEKVRLSRGIAQRLGWQVRKVGWLLVMPDTSTLRRKVAAHASIFDRSFPLRGNAIRAWIRRPSGAIAGLWFLSAIARSDGMQAGGGRARVRKPKSPPGIAARVA